VQRYCLKVRNQDEIEERLASGSRSRCEMPISGLGIVCVA